jgi:tight adherence protein C
MTLTPGTLTAISLALLALGLLVAGGAMIAAELRRARSGQAIGKAIERGTTAFAGMPADPEVDLGQPYKSDVELPFRCGMSSQRTQLIFLVTRIVLALLLPAVAFVLWSPGYKQNLLFPVLAALFVVGFMSPKWILGRIAANRRERVAKELPLFVDLLKLLQGVGMSLDQSLQIMAADFSHVLRVLGHELTLANRQYSQGRTREHSLHRLATLHKDENLRGLVTLLVQVDRHGGAVQEPLRTFSDRLREHRRSEMKERIGKITVKMTAVMVTTLLPALVIVTAGPGFIAIFRALGSTAK